MLKDKTLKKTRTLLGDGKGTTKKLCYKDFAERSGELSGAILETAFEKVLRRVLRRCLAVGFNGKKGSKKGS